MKLWKLERVLYKSARLVGDVNAVKRGRYGHRLVKRAVNRGIWRVLRRVI